MNTEEKELPLKMSETVMTEVNSTQEQQTQAEAENQDNIVKFELPSGTKVELDKSKNTARTLLEARKKAENDAELVALFMICELCTFDGKKLIPPELMDFEAFDIIELESQWAELRKKRK